MRALIHTCNRLLVLATSQLSWAVAGVYLLQRLQPEHPVHVYVQVLDHCDTWSFRGHDHGRSRVMVCMMYVCL